jgi:ABC-type multidrug transport system permease subunit
MRFAKFGMLILIAATLLAACATQPTPTAIEPPGFLLGLVHGFISPFALIAELFTNVRVYAFPNNGGWYDFGFMLGVGLILGGGGAAT